MTEKTRRTVIPILAVAVAALLVIPLFFAGGDANTVFTRRNMTAPIIYFVAMIASAAILIGYIIHNSRKFLWIILLFVSITIANFGYLAISMSSNVSEALLGNRISYLGNVYMLLFLLFTIKSACRLTNKVYVNVTLFAVSTIMYFLQAHRAIWIFSTGMWILQLWTAMQQ